MQKNEWKNHYISKNRRTLGLSGMFCKGEDQYIGTHHIVHSAGITSGEGVKENISTDSRKGNTHIIIAKEPKDTSC